jgi:SAM-dependent methyltransferase
MIASIAEHYDTHLAEHYSWLFGGLPERAAENKRLFEAMGLVARTTKRALDLGAGSGFQSIPLAQLGFEVTAVDLSKKLLGELASSAKGLRITTKNDDMLRYLASAEPGFEVCVCMGDTLTHLSSFGDVQRVFREVHRVLAPGGTFVLAFRDFTRALEGVDRFIPVRADESTVFTCFLEYEGDHVRVYDLIHQRTESGWELKKSVYRKLRVSGDWARKRLTEVGFAIEKDEDSRGMVTIVGRRG